MSVKVAKQCARISDLAAQSFDANLDYHHQTTVCDHRFWRQEISSAVVLGALRASGWGRVLANTCKL